MKLGTDVLFRPKGPFVPQHLVVPTAERARVFAGAVCLMG